MTDAATELQLQPGNSSGPDQRKVTDFLDVSMMFAKMDYLRDSDMLHHLPLLNWLTEVSRPECVLMVGLGQGVPYFAVCQSVEYCEISARCIGMEAEDLSDEVKDHNAEQYQAFSTLIEMPDARALAQIAPGSVDLLVVDRPLDQVLDLLRNGLREALSPRGLLLIHRSNQIGPKERDAFEQLWSSCEGLSFKDGEGLWVLAVSQDVPDPAKALLQSRPEMKPLLSMFRTLGRGQVAEGRLREQERRGMGSYSSKDGKAAADKTNREAFKISELEKQLERSQREIVELSRMFIEETYRHEATRQEIDMKQGEIAGLRSSTSWRVTAPLRNIRLALGRKG